MEDEPLGRPEGCIHNFERGARHFCRERPGQSPPRDLAGKGVQDRRQVGKSGQDPDASNDRHPDLVDRCGLEVPKKVWMDREGMLRIRRSHEPAPDLAEQVRLPHHPLPNDDPFLSPKLRGHAVVSVPGEGKRQLLQPIPKVGVGLGTRRLRRLPCVVGASGNPDHFARPN